MPDKGNTRTGLGRMRSCREDVAQVLLPGFVLGNGRLGQAANLKARFSEPGREPLAHTVDPVRVGRGGINAHQFLQQGEHGRFLVLKDRVQRGFPLCRFHGSAPYPR